MPEVTLMQETEIAEVAALENEIFTDAWSEAGIRDTWKEPQAFILTASESGQVIGYCIVYYVLDEATIERIAVKPSDRKKGAGRILLQEVRKKCREKQITRLLLEVREHNETAIRFYEKQGFAVDGMRKNFYRNPVEHAVLMSAVIGE